MIRTSSNHIWIVDRDSATANRAARTLSDMGYSSTLFPNPETLLRDHPKYPKARAIILEDDCLDGMDCSYIEDLSSKLYSVPVIIATDFPDDNLWVHYIQRGAVDLVGKSYPRKQLSKALKLVDLRKTDKLGKLCFAAESPRLRASD